MILHCHHITKSFGATTVLSQVSLKIEAGERLGLVGANGAGKSTLLNILAGHLAPDEGEVAMAREARVGYLRQDGGLRSARTVGDELLAVFAPLVAARDELAALETQLGPEHEAHDDAAYEGLLTRHRALSEWFAANGGHEIEARIAAVTNGMGLGGLPRDLVVDGLSGGQKTRLALAKLLLERPDLLLLDEPTNHLDFATLDWLEAYLRAYPGALVIVSHDRYFLDHLVTAIGEIERTRIRRYTGNYTRFMEQKAKDREVQRRRHEQQQAEVARGEDWIQRHQARATSARAAKSRRKALDRIELVERPEAELKRARFTFRAGEPSWREVLRVENLDVGVGPPEGRVRLLTGVNLTLLRGDKVGLIGANGIGKTTLLQTLVGRHEPDGGTSQWGERVRVGYYDQEHVELDPDLTVLEQLRHWFPKLPPERLRTVLGGFLFSGDDVDKPTAALSGGERARVALARLMLQEPNVLVLDEPTNHLDLAAKEMLESALEGYDGTLLFVSHSRYFLNRLARRIVELSARGAKVYEGNYESYAARKAEEAVLAGATPARETEPPTDRQEFQASRRSQREEEVRLRELEQLEARIEQLEAALGLIEGSMADPAVATNPALLQERHGLAKRRREELRECYETWEGLLE